MPARAYRTQAANVNASGSTFLNHGPLQKPIRRSFRAALRIHHSPQARGGRKLQAAPPGCLARGSEQDFDMPYRELFHFPAGWSALQLFRIRRNRPRRGPAENGCRPETQAWWAITNPMQTPLANRAEG